MIVIDASVAVKWFFAEQNSEIAAQLMTEHAGHMRMPEQFLTEVLGTMIREINMDRQREPETRPSIERFFSLWNDRYFTTQSSIEVYRRAADIAIELGHPIKDCLYLALAEALEAPLITADVRFANKARLVYPDVHILGE